jgi:hypothetical protein
MTQISADDLRALEQRVGRVHLRQRLGIERDNEARVFGQGFNFFHIENWYSVHGFMRGALRLAGLLGRGRRNALHPQVVENEIALARLPRAFDGFRILQISDPHLDINEDVPHALIECVRGIDHDVCVLTGDFRGKTYGPYARVVEAMRAVRAHLKDPVYGILGNHDTIGLVPGFEAAGVRMLLNESVAVTRAGATVHLAGVDDAHYYRMANLEAAARDIPADAASILLCHTPELYRHAAHAGFGAMLCGHTHGGQVCLPGGFPLMLNARCPRHVCIGAWKFHDMLGYTSRGSGVSIVDVRYNCPPEVTVHILRAGQ